MCAGGVIAFEIARQLQDAGGAGGHGRPARRGRPGGAAQGLAGGRPPAPAFRRRVPGGRGRPARAAALATILGKVLEESSELRRSTWSGERLGRARDEIRMQAVPRPAGSGPAAAAGPGQDPRADRLPVRRAGLPARRPVRRRAGAVPGHRRHRPRRALHRTLRRSPAGLGPARDPGVRAIDVPGGHVEHAPGAPRRGPGRADAVLHRRGPGRRGAAAMRSRPCAVDVVRPGPSPGHRPAGGDHP